MRDILKTFRHSDWPVLSLPGQPLTLWGRGETLKKTDPWFGLAMSLIIPRASNNPLFSTGHFLS